MTIAVKIMLIEDADTHPSGNKSDVRPMLHVSYVHASTRGPIERHLGDLTPSQREITCHVTDVRDIRISKVASV